MGFPLSTFHTFFSFPHTFFLLVAMIENMTTQKVKHNRNEKRRDVM